VDSEGEGDRKLCAVSSDIQIPTRLELFITPVLRAVDNRHSARVATGVICNTARLAKGVTKHADH